MCASWLDFNYGLPGRTVGSLADYRHLENSGPEGLCNADFKLRRGHPAKNPVLLSEFHNVVWTAVVVAYLQDGRCHRIQRSNHPYRFRDELIGRPHDRTSRWV